MAKSEWGSKQTCPECSTRFYDLGKDDPVTCISCGHAWTPEPLLKSKQMEPRAPKPKVEEKPKAADDDGAAATPDAAKDDDDVDSAAVAGADIDKSKK